MASLWQLKQRLDTCRKKKKELEEDNRILSSVTSDVSSLKGEISSIMSNIRSGAKSDLKEGFGGTTGNNLQAEINFSLLHLQTAQARTLNLSSEVEDRIAKNNDAIESLNAEIEDLIWQIQQYEE